MMKKSTLILLLASLTNAASAQTIQEKKRAFIRRKMG